MKVTEEILNKYIDNELSATEVKELKDYLSENPEEVEKLKALKLVDNVLKEMEFESAPQNFTERMMERLNVTYSTKAGNNSFIKIVFAFFGLGFIGITLFGISQMSLSSSEKNDNFIEHIFKRLGEILPSFSFSISSETFMLIVSILVLVTLIATYIIVNSHKVFKNNIENLLH